jgi:hypothetical protein
MNIFLIKDSKAKVTLGRCMMAPTATGITREQLDASIANDPTFLERITALQNEMPPESVLVRGNDRNEQTAAESTSSLSQVDVRYLKIVASSMPSIRY